MRRLVRLGPLVFRDPLLLCGALYLLLWFDASGVLRIGLCAAILHEIGHIFVYLLLLYAIHKEIYYRHFILC